MRSGAYYEKSVIWAAANGIVTGTDSTSFSPTPRSRVSSLPRSCTAMRSTGSWTPMRAQS
ncbi:MAG: S-layer homology domain-containing protein [Acutalibacteraceae bacterium]